MSSMIFFASDYVLEDVVNPYIKTFSINEALSQGLDVPEWLFEDKADVDREKPDAILWIDDEEHFNEITITSFDKTPFIDDFPTTKKYCSELCWRFSDERATQLIKYIQKHLLKSNEIELWNIWNGYLEEIVPLKKYSVNIENLTFDDIKMVSENKGFENQVCLVIHSSK